MRRHPLRPAARRAPLLLLVLLLVAVAAVALGGVAGAQTTTVPTTVPPATTTPTVAPTVSPTTAAGSTTTAAGTVTTAPASATTVAVDTKDDGGSSIPWVPIAIGVAVLALILVAIVILAKRRGAARQVVTDWKRRAADVTAEAGATARLLSTGTPATGQIAQQLLASLRGFEDLEHSAPDDATAATAERARRALQTLGLAIDADYRTRRAQPAPGPDQLAQSQESVKLAAGETDRTLRGVYRSVTDAD